MKKTQVNMSSHSQDLASRDEAMHYMRGILDRFKTTDRGSEIRSFETRKSDVIVTTFPKSGTVLLQQMIYQIAVHSGGAPPADPTGEEYEDISNTVPWIEMRNFLKLPDSQTTPRTLKSHFPITSFVPGSMRHVVVIRDPQSFPASFLNFMFDVVHYKQSTKLSDEVLQECVDIMAREGLINCDMYNREQYAIPHWHEYIKKCVWPPRENVFVLFYEDVIVNLEKTCRRVARFMNCNVPGDAFATIAARCEQDYMAASSKFQGFRTQKLFGQPSHAIKARPKDYVGFKRFKMRAELVKDLEKYNLEVFGVRSYPEIRKFITKEQFDFHGY